VCEKLGFFTGARTHRGSFGEGGNENKEKIQKNMRNHKSYFASATSSEFFVKPPVEWVVGVTCSGSKSQNIQSSKKRQQNN